MKQAIIFGFGNIGKCLNKKLANENVKIKGFVRKSGIYNTFGRKIEEQKNWKKIATQANLAFIAIPSYSKGEEALAYSLYFLKKGCFFARRPDDSSIIAGTIGGRSFRPNDLIKFNLASISLN